VRLSPKEDEINKGSDVIVTENGIDRFIQISRLTFTNYERRKQIAKKQSIAFARRVHKGIPSFKFEIVVKIFPKGKHKVPLSNQSNRERSNIENGLLAAISKVITDNVDQINQRQRLQVDLSADQLGKYFYSFDVYPVPDGFFANVWGHENVFIEYDFAGSTSNEIDEDTAISELFERKNNGRADTLLIWCDSFELQDEQRVANKVMAKFKYAHFQEVFLMTFRNNWEGFMRTLKLWPLK